MFLDIFKALFFAGLSIAAISYYLVMLTAKKTVLKSSNSKELQQELKTLSMEKGQSEGHFVQDMLHKKFLKFGGGFYGILAFITYIHIEIMQVINFVRNFPSFQQFLDSLGFKMVVNFLIEAVMNLVQAFMWPVYWYKYLPIGSLWIWIVVAVGAYTSATNYALSKINSSEQ